MTQSILNCGAVCETEKQAGKRVAQAWCSETSRCPRQHSVPVVSTGHLSSQTRAALRVSGQQGHKVPAFITEPSEPGVRVQLERLGLVLSGAGMTSRGSFRAQRGVESEGLRFNAVTRSQLKLWPVTA